MKKYISILYIIALIALDQIIKVIVDINLGVGEGFAVIEDILHIEYIQNTGAAWGMMSGATCFFAIFAVIVTSVLMWIYIKIPADKIYRPLKIAMVLLVSGAVGNLIDRVTRGFVVDYIYFKIIDFPVFNLADIFITCSSILLILLILFYYKDEHFDFLRIKKLDTKTEKLSDKK